MTADLRPTLDPDVLAGFAARGIGEAQAAELLSEAEARLTAPELRFAVETLTQTRLLTWPECMRFAQLHRPLS
ncbi:MAG: hypothetical protein ACJ74U_13205 [Jatrophihabitantaceae bacterium]